MGYDFVLTAETIYSPDSQSKLLGLIKQAGGQYRRLDGAWRQQQRPRSPFPQVLKPGTGVAYVAAKTYYFGVGGGTRQFEQLLDSDGALSHEKVFSADDGSSNLREVLKLTWKQ